GPAATPSPPPKDGTASRPTTARPVSWNMACCSCSHRGDSKAGKVQARGERREWRTVAHLNKRDADEALALALGSGGTLRAAAAPAGIDERTAERRYADPDFRHRVKQIAGTMIDRISAGLRRLPDSMGIRCDLSEPPAAAVVRRPPSGQEAPSTHGTNG